MSDPALLEDDRQAAWDRRLASLPLCDICGESITDCTRYYFAKQDLFFCPRCVSSMEEPNEPFEIEYPEED